jgi:chromosome segregation ATPase
MPSSSGHSHPLASESEIVEIPRGNDLLASLAVAVGLPLIMLAGVLKGLNPDRVETRSALLSTTAAGTGGAGGANRNWSPELSALQARLDESEQRNAMLDAELEKLLSEIREVREVARLARQEQAESEIVHRERLQGFAYQVAGMTQRLADGREAESTLHTELTAARQEGRSFAALADQRGAENGRLKGEVAALTEIGQVTQTRLVAVQNLADARKRDADSLTQQLSSERDLVAQTRQELASARALADQRLVQIGQLEAGRKEITARGEERIGALQRSLDEVRGLAAKQAAELQAAEDGLTSLRQAVSQLSSGLVK